LTGLAAPEGDEPGGQAATRAMIELVDDRILRCELDGDRTHDRCVGICYLDGADISAEMCAAVWLEIARASAAADTTRRS
jgi:endonuclease YncB( thermonuclease family)